MDRSENTRKALEKFGKYLVKESRKNLTRMGKNTTSTLYESLGYDVRVSRNSIDFDFLMEDYGEWVDKGRKAGTPPPFSAIREWVQNRRIQFRDNSGKFKTYDTTAWAIVKKIGRDGIKPSNFYTRPFNLGYARLPDEVAFAYALDVQDFLEFSLNKINTKYKEDGDN
jgi:hypothetical protein